MAFTICKCGKYLHISDVLENNKCPDCGEDFYREFFLCENIDEVRKLFSEMDLIKLGTNDNHSNQIVINLRTLILKKVNKVK